MLVASRRLVVHARIAAPICRRFCGNDHDALVARLRSMPAAERDQLWQRVHETEPTTIDTAGAPTSLAQPTNRQLRFLFIATAAPMVGFGFVDNCIMIVAGEFIEVKLGAAFALSTLAAAGLGNLISDVVGLSAGGVIESAAVKAGLSEGAVAFSAAQAATSAARFTRGSAAVIGISIGCLLGMFPLLFYDEDDARLRKIFERYDIDGDGGIDREEIGRAFADAHQHPTEEQLDHLFEVFDIDKNGALDFSEFKTMVEHVEKEVKNCNAAQSRLFMQAAHTVSRAASELRRKDEDGGLQRA